MKKFLAILMAAMMMLSMAACTAAPADENNGDAAQKYVVGICQLIKHDALDAATQGFKDALVAALGDAVEFKEENASGDSNTCATIVNTFVNDEVDLIMANATPALQAAAAATDEIPILGTSVTEYGVALEIENFSGTVGTNISGTSDLADLKEQAAMLIEWFPEAKNVGLLYCSAEPNSTYQVNTVKAELEGKGLTCTLYSFADTNDLQAVTQKAADASDVIYVPTDNQCASAVESIDSICRDAGVPIIAGEEGICKGCGVATLCVNYYDLGYQTGLMAAEILLEGKSPADIEIQTLTPSVAYNEELCARLGIAAE